MATKTKTVKVLEKSGVSEEGLVRFDWRYDDPGAELLMRVAMAPQEYEDFGSPDHITVTVVPGMVI